MNGTSILALIPFARRFVRKDDGVATIELAMLIAPFFSLVFATIEIGYLLYSQTVVENALYDSARLVRTGQVAEQEMTKNDFLNQFCASIDFLTDCSTNITVEMRSFSNFTLADLEDPNCSVDDQGSLPYEPGNAGEVVLLRVCYNYKAVTPGIGKLLTSLSDGGQAIVITSAFRNEPFDEML